MIPMLVWMLPLSAFKEIDGRCRLTQREKKRQATSPISNTACTAATSVYYRPACYPPVQLEHNIY